MENTTINKINISKIEEIKLNYPFELPKLKFTYDSLEPHIDSQTMDIHFNKHHYAYVTNLNNALNEKEYKSKNLVELINNINQYPDAIKNNAGGHFNHTLFWSILTPHQKNVKKFEIFIKINETFSNFESLKELVNKAAMSRFGSGWSWLSVDEDGKLFVSSTPNQENPLMSDERKGFPILGIDVWEHAYYLKYQNRRADYLDSIWNLIDWEEVNNRYLKLMK